MDFEFLNICQKMASTFSRLPNLKSEAKSQYSLDQKKGFDHTALLPNLSNSWREEPTSTPGMTVTSLPQTVRSWDLARYIQGTQSERIDKIEKQRPQRNFDTLESPTMTPAKRQRVGNNHDSRFRDGHEEDINRLQAYALTTSSAGNQSQCLGQIKQQISKLKREASAADLLLSPKRQRMRHDLDISRPNGKDKVSTQLKVKHESDGSATADATMPLDKRAQNGTNRSDSKTDSMDFKDPGTCLTTATQDTKRVFNRAETSHYVYHVNSCTTTSRRATKVCNNGKAGQVIGFGRDDAPFGSEDPINDLMTKGKPSEVVTRVSNPEKNPTPFRRYPKTEDKHELPLLKRTATATSKATYQNQSAENTGSVQFLDIHQYLHQRFHSTKSSILRKQLASLASGLTNASVYSVR